MCLIQKLDHHFLVILIWDILYHQSRSLVFPFDKTLHINHKIIGILMSLFPACQSGLHIALVFKTSLVKILIISSCG